MKISVVLEALTGSFETDLKRASRSVDKNAKDMSKSLKAAEAQGRALGSFIGKGLAAIAGGAVFTTIIRNTAEAEKASARLDNVLKATGNTAGFTSKQLVDYANQLQKTTIFEDDAIVSSQALLAQFQNIRGEIYTRTLDAVVDLASATGQDLTAAMQTVGKAINDPLKGMRALAEFGITFSDQQKKLAKELIATGRGAEVQEMLLKRLEETYEGAAEAAANTLGGALTRLKNSIGNLLEGDSASVEGLTKSISTLTDTLNDPEVKSGIATIIKGIVDITAKAVAAIPAIVEFGQNVAKAFGVGGSTISRIEKLRADIAKGEEFQSGRHSVAAQVQNTRELIQQRQELKKLEDQFRRENQALIDARNKGTDGRLRPSSSSNKPLIFGGGGDGGEGAAKKAADAAARAAEKLAEAQKRALESVQDMNAGLSQQIATFGMSEDKVLEYRLTFGDLSDEIGLAGDAGRDLIPVIVENQRKLQELQKQAEEQVEQEGYLKNLRKESIEIIENNATSVQRLQSQMSMLSEAYARGTINTDEFVKAQQILVKQIEEAEQEAKKASNEMSVFAEEAARNMQSAFADFLFDPFDEGLKGMVRGFAQTLHRMASEALAAKILENIFGGLSGSSNSLLSSFGSAFISSRDSGGRGVPGEPYVIGRGAQPEIFIPDSTGTFIPNADKMMGGSNVRILNVIDPSMVQDYLSTPAGEKAIVNVLRRNSGSLRSVLA